MESNFEMQMHDVHKNEGVFGCLLTDQSGLCLGVKGDASSESAGAIAAINNIAKKLEPGLPAPIICLQGETKKCLIQQHGNVIGAVYKNKS